MPETNINSFIDKIITSNNVVLFMKGTKDFPQCGFSATVVNILKNLKVEFKDINVLHNEEVRKNIKIYSDWPTIPQLYVKGTFIGGCDIVKALYEQGQLQKTHKDL